MIGDEQLRLNRPTADGWQVATQWRSRAGLSLLTRQYWQRPLLALILGLSAALNIVGLTSEGYANTYYAAAVKSMLTSWHNFFFVAFDSGGFISVDKPPLGLWIQAISARIFGFSALSILLPQALAGVASVALLYWLVRQYWGAAAGLIAAAVLAVTPISVVTSRNNTSDTVLVFVLLCAAWAMSRAIATERLGWLLLSGACVGLGFNIKMLEAYLILPALALVYLLGAKGRWPLRLGRLLLFGAMTLAVSLAWVIVVDLTPATLRPYVGSSGTNSALSLVLGYNGLSRLTLALPASVRSALTFLPGNLDLDLAPAFAPGIGDPGLLRLFNSGLADQASWLLPLAVVGVVAGAGAAWRRWPLSAQGLSLVFWAGWLVGTGGFFSVARFYHLYYLTILGPGIAALAGIAVAALWRAWQRGGIAALLLPAVLFGTALVQTKLLTTNATWSARLVVPILVVCGLAASGIVAVRLWMRLGRVIAPVLATVAMAALLVTPLVWSVTSVQAGNGGAWLPQAGPANSGGRAVSNAPFGQPPATTNGRQSGQQPVRGMQGAPAAPANGNRAGGGSGGQALTIAGANWDTLDAGLVQYLLAQQGQATFLVATPSSTYASVFMLATDQPAMALGGYQGWDPVLTVADLQQLVQQNTVRFFYLNASGTTNRTGSGTMAGPNGGVSIVDATADLAAWVRSSCAVVPATTWLGTTSSGQSSQQLYDCAAVTTR